VHCTRDRRYRYLIKSEVIREGLCPDLQRHGFGQMWSFVQLETLISDPDAARRYLIDSWAATALAIEHAIAETCAECHIISGCV
jgi:hypothetical protein